MGAGWTVGDDLAAHRAAVAGLLAADPVGRTGQGTILANLAAGVRWSDLPPVFAVHRDAAGVVDAMAVRTPPHPLQLDGDADPAGLVAALAGHEVGGVNGPEPVARAFAAAWVDARGGTVVERRRLHLLALPSSAALRPPPGPASARAATDADLGAVRALTDAMRTEIGERGSSPVQVLTDRIAAGLVWVVDGEDGPVATAQASAAAAGVSRVAGVYTLPVHRGRGLAAVATAAATRAAYAAGAGHVCLFTDTANPTSNGVYERLGYVRAPRDRVVLEFAAPRRTGA